MGEGWTSGLRDPEASWPPDVGGKEVTRKSRQVSGTPEARLWKLRLAPEAKASGVLRVLAGEGPPSGGLLWKDAWVACWRSLLRSEREMVVACHGNGGVRTSQNLVTPEAWAQWTLTTNVVAKEQGGVQSEATCPVGQLSRWWTSPPQCLPWSPEPTPYLPPPSQ